MSQTTLYRKYRSQTFAEIIGQELVTRVLRSEITLSKIAHAYVFSGPRGVGKTSIARILAKAINCPDAKDGDACGICKVCVAIADGSFPDVIEIDAASNRGIDEIRELRKSVRYAPVQGKYKVVIIDEAHQLTGAAANALLKTLEEPPSFLVFVLATTEVHQLPVTILSRTQRFAFRTVDTPIVAAHVRALAEKEGYSLSEPAAERIATAGEGSVRDAVGLLGQVLAIATEQQITDDQVDLLLPPSPKEQLAAWLTSLMERDAVACFLVIDQLLDEGFSIDRFIREVLVMLERSMRGDGVQGFSVAEMTKLLELHLTAYRQFGFSPLPQLPLEILVGTWCGKEASVAVASSVSSLTTPPTTRAAAPITSVSAPATSATGMKPVSSPQSLSAASDVAQVIVESPIVSQPTASSLSTAPEEVAAALAAPVHASSDPAVELLTVRDRWQEIIFVATKKNRALPFVLKVGKPTAVHENMIEVSFKYKLQFEKAKSEPMRSIIEAAMTEVLGIKVGITPKFDEAVELQVVAPAALEAKAPETSVDAALAAFGGEVI